MRDSAIKGYDKWREFATDTFNAILAMEDELRPDLYIILIGHVEQSSDLEDNRIVKFLTPGKLLDSQIKIPSYVSYILHTDVREEDGVVHYRFLTNRNSSGKEAKSPEGALELFEENDYSQIIAKIEKYHNE